MDVEKLKQEYLNTLSELQNEILVLQSRIKKAKNQLECVKTEEHIEKFRRENDLEDGMKLPAAELRGISPRLASLIISLLRSRAAGN